MALDSRQNQLESMKFSSSQPQSVFINMGVSKNSGTPKSSILMGFSIINHPFLGTPIFGNTHIVVISQSSLLVRKLKSARDRTWQIGNDVVSGGFSSGGQRFLASKKNCANSREIPGTPNNGTPHGKLPIQFPYFKGFLWEWYGSTSQV